MRHLLYTFFLLNVLVRPGRPGEVKSGERLGMTIDSGSLFSSQTGLAVPVVGPHELCALFQMAALRRHRAAAIADSVVCAAIHRKEI